MRFRRKGDVAPLGNTNFEAPGEPYTITPIPVGDAWDSVQVQDLLPLKPWKPHRPMETPWAHSGPNFSHHRTAETRSAAAAVEGVEVGA